MMAQLADLNKTKGPRVQLSFNLLNMCNNFFLSFFVTLRSTATLDRPPQWPPYVEKVMYSVPVF
jgi:hypothetical protein